MFKLILSCSGKHFCNLFDPLICRTKCLKLFSKYFLQFLRALCFKCNKKGCGSVSGWSTTQQQQQQQQQQQHGKKGCETQQPRNIGRVPSKPKLVCHFK